MLVDEVSFALLPLAIDAVRNPTPGPVIVDVELDIDDAGRTKYGLRDCMFCMEGGDDTVGPDFFCDVGGL